MSRRRLAKVALLAVVCGVLTHVAPPAQATAKHHHKRPKVSVRDVVVTETDAAGLATFKFTLKKGTGRKVKVWWATSDGTASSPADYTASSGKVVFKGRAKKQTESVSVPVNGDDVTEGAETFAVHLTKVKHGVIKDDSAIATIVDDDAGPPGTHQLTITRSGPGTGTVSSSPAGIDCPGTCSAWFPAGTTVTVFPHPKLNSGTGFWGGACLGKRLTSCSVSMTADKDVDVGFRKLGLHLDATAPAINGEANLSNGFSPDPYGLATTDGGPVDVSYLGGSCHGFASVAPTLRVNFGGGGATLLRIYDVSTNGDAKMVINDPFGNFYCVDNSFSTTNPTIDFNNPAGGSYDIWVCSETSTASITGTLRLTQSAANHP